MSAGGLNYDALQTKRRATLPSVEMWNTNMNILKDPPKGVYTRRIDKVGDTQNTLMETDASGDRACEYIQVYARGVNPMVSVSYDNFSNNGGQNVMANNISFYQNQVRYPYRVETLRPPILRQEDLLPLSRLPRVWYHAETNPQFPEFRQHNQCNEQKSSITADPLRPVEKKCGLASGPTRDRTVEGEYSNHSTRSDVLQAVDDGVRPTGHDREAGLVSTKPSSGAREDILHIGAETNRSTITAQRQAERGDPASLAQIDRNKRVYEAFSTKSLSGRGPTEDSAHDSSVSRKSINANLLYIQAQTNNQGAVSGRVLDSPSLPAREASRDVFRIRVDAPRGMENFEYDLSERVDHALEDSSVVPTRSMIYRHVEAPRQQIGGGDVNDQETEPTKGIIENPRHASAMTQKSARQGVPDHDPSSLMKRSTHDQIIHVDVHGRQTIPNSVEHGYLEASNRPDPVHEKIIHAEVQGRQVMNHYSRMEEPDHNLATIPTIERVRGSAESARSMAGQGVVYKDDPILLSRLPERSIPHYQSMSASGGVENEHERGNLRQLDRRSVLVQDLDTISTHNLPMYSDVYEQDVQSRQPRNQRQRLPMEGFMHNRAAIPIINEGSNHVPVTDDRVQLRKKAFDQFMERTFVPPPIEYTAYR